MADALNVSVDGQSADQRNLMLVDDLWIDADTGEVVGLATPFQVNDEDSANWVLEKIMNAEADIAREQMKLRAIQERSQANVKRLDRRVEWLKARFGPELEEFASKQLEGKKSRTLNLLFGKLSFRKNAGGIRVADEMPAIEWAKAKCPDAVKVKESFLISSLSPDVLAELAALDDESLERLGLRREPSSETFSISTGVGG
ncbi:MAG: host-nuclease inhibitor Gam family protein [Bryobacteraceae bacterium]